MHGDTPKAKIEKFCKPPPLIKLNISKKPNSSYILEAHGIVIDVPKQNNPKQTKVKYILFLKSLFDLLNIWENPRNI